MKKLRWGLVLVAVFIACAAALTACGGQGQKEYSVVFDYGFEGKRDVRLADEGKPVSEPPVPFRDGYDFEGWREERAEKDFDFTQAISKNTVLHARWSGEGEDLYIIYNLEYDGKIETRRHKSGTELYRPSDPLRAGYILDGWTVTSGGENYTFGQVVSSGLTLYARWKEAAAVHTVRFLDRMGKEYTARSVEDGQSVRNVPAVPTDFKWYKNGRWKGSYTNVKKDETVRAEYDYAASDNQNFRFEPNNGGQSYSVGVTNDFEVMLPLELALPAVYNDAPVTAIIPGGFANMYGPQKVFVPSVYKEIPAEAFAFCWGMEEVTLDEGITRVEAYAFAACGTLATLSIPSTLEKLEPAFAFNAQALENIIIRNNTGFVFEQGGLYDAGKKTLMHVRPSLTQFTVPASVTDMYPYMFANNQKIKKVTVLGHVKEFGAGLFATARNLEAVEIKGSVERIAGDDDLPNCYTGSAPLEKLAAFSTTNALAEAVLPEGIKYIGKNAYTFTRNLKKISIASSIELIGRNAFRNNGAGNLEEIVMTGGTTSRNGRYNIEHNALIEINRPGLFFPYMDDVFCLYAQAAPATEYTVPDGVRTFWQFAFASLLYLEKVTLPETVYELPAGLFRGEYSVEIADPGKPDVAGSSIKEVVLPSSLRRIESFVGVWDEWAYFNDQGAFQFCSNLETVSFPDGNWLEYVGPYTFASSGITDFEIGSALYYLDGTAFMGCKNLESFSVSESNRNFSEQDGVLFDKTKEILLQYPAGSKIKEYTVPDNVHTLGYGAFAGNFYLEKLNTGNVEMIEPNAVTGLLSLTEVVLSSALEILYVYNFDSCRELKRVVFSSAVPPMFIAVDYPSWFIFTEEIMDENGWPLGIENRLPEGIEFVIPVLPEAVTEYLILFRELGYAMNVDLTACISEAGHTLTSYKFFSEGTMIREENKLLINKMFKPEDAEQDGFFQGWYTKDGTGGDWGERLEFPLYHSGTAELLLYAKWAGAAMEDGSTDFPYLVEFQTEKTLNIGDAQNIWMEFTAPVRGRYYIDSGDVVMNAAFYSRTESKISYMLGEYIEAGQTVYIYTFEIIGNETGLVQVSIQKFWEPGDDEIFTQSGKLPAASPAHIAESDISHKKQIWSI